MESSINRSRLFYAACISLVVTSMTFAFRARLETVFGPDGKGISLEDIGWAFGPAFWGFTLAMMIGGPLADRLGMKKIAVLAFVMHILGIIATMFAYDKITLFGATALIGVGNGFVEAAFNPLIASLYPNQKTKMLNRFHVWFPGGLVIGGLVGYLVMDQMGQSWQLMIALLFIPTLIYGFMLFKEKFPVTERVAMGVSEGKMWASLATPLYIFIGICMLMTAATELGTNQRIETLLKETGTSGLLVLAFINGIMALGRLFGGGFIHRISIPVVLLFSAIFSFLGLYLLSTTGGNMLWVSAAVFAVGITFFWPNMISFVAEYIPQSGALGLSVMGGLGMLSVSFVLPYMGRLIGDYGGQEAIGIMSYLPAVLIALFAGLLLYMRSKNIQPVHTASAEE
ncbi:MAG: MFS transporter [Bacteroidota bacterium]